MARTPASRTTRTPASSRTARASAPTRALPAPTLDATAAAYLSVERSTLKKWRCVGIGPAYVKLGAKVVYLIEDLDQYLLAHRISA